MKQNMVETILGAIVLIIAAIFFMYSSGTSNAGKTSSSYEIHAQFTDIGTLSVGDDVKISGVLIGSIEDINLDPVLYNADVTLLINKDIKLPYDTSARVSSEGFLGGTYLALDIGGDEELLEKGDAIAITQSAQNLEQLLGQFIFSMKDSDNE